MAAVHTLLTGLARERATGSLNVLPAGKAYLREGRITHLECPRTPSVERLLTARGGAGAYSRAELEFCVAGAVLDAAYFLLPAELPAARPKFRPGECPRPHTRLEFELAWLVGECARRRAQLAQIWSSAELDDVPVTPAARLPGHRATVSALEWEILLGADRVATPAELADRLGQPAYSVLLAVRRLAAAGLLVAPLMPRRRGRALDRSVPPALPQSDPDVLAAVKRALEELA
ncbi:hypothetical protein ACFWYW_16235 [Nonomuraea sp. NPDC059023]|uniref:hypothetical protein n=1 Tax=unclassified Nonomuraea TaxID=2593643 RepID=UPI0036909D21